MFNFIVVKMRGKISSKIKLLFKLNRLVRIPMFVTKQVRLFTWQFTVFYHRRFFTLRRIRTEHYLRRLTFLVKISSLDSIGLFEKYGEAPRL